MKHYRTFFALLALFTIVAMDGFAQNTITATYGKGNGTFYKADGTATSSGFDAKTFVSNTTPAVTVACSYDTGLNSGDAANGARLGANAGDNTYTISVPDGYVITGYELDAWAVNASHPAKTLTLADGTEYNVSSTTSQNISVTGLGTQSTYFTITTTGWSPIKTKNFKIYVKEYSFNIVYNCYDENDVLLETVTSTETYAHGATVDVSGFTHDIPGYTLQSITPTSVTINGANAEVNVVYAAAASFDYTVAFAELPYGTTVAIKGDEVADGASVTFDDAVTENEVVVNFPDGYNYMVSTITIEGSTITVSAYDPRWPVNFPKTQTFTRSDRHINSVTFDIEGEDQTVDGLYESTSTLCYQDLTATKTVSLPTETSVHPVLSVSGGWQHGFVYIDLNNDGDFTDNGELVSKINEGNPNLASAMPNFTTPATEGYYRMRIKTDWSSEDPGGNEGDDPGNVNGNNHIIKNGGMIVDVTLNIYRPSCTVTYIVKDTGGTTLFTSEPIATTSGTNITTLPEGYQRADFYSYNEVDVTISNNGNTDVEFTATPKESPLVKYTADAANPVWYKLKLKGSNYPTYVANPGDGEDNVQTPTEDANDETVQWAFIGEPYAGFQIINRAAGTGLILGSATTIGIEDTGASVHTSLAASGTRARELWYITASTYLTGGFFIKNADGHALNQRGAGFLAYWTAGADMGSTFTGTEVHEGEALFNELIAQLKAIKFGTGLNQYGFTGNYAGYTSQAATIISGLEGNYTDENLAVAQELLANYALNMPSAGFYRIKGNTSGKYLAAGMASNGKFNMAELTDETKATDASTIFYFDGTKLTNFGSGMCNGVTASTWAWVTEDEASTVVFQDGLTNGGYAIKTATANFYDNGDNGSADRGGNVSINSSTDERYTSWYLTEVTSLPITLNDGSDGSYYATLCVPFGITIEGATAYTLTKDGSTLNMSDGFTTVTGGTPVLLIGTGASATATITPGEPATIVSSTLTGTYEAIAFDGDTNYVLGTDGNKVGFFHWDGTELKGFRAYIEGEAAVGVGTEVKGFYLNHDIATQIREMVGASDGKATYYDLSGRRVTQPARGLYIVNGKKVAVK